MVALQSVCPCHAPRFNFYALHLVSAIKNNTRWAYITIFIQLAPQPFWVVQSGAVFMLAVLAERFSGTRYDKACFCISLSKRSTKHYVCSSRNYASTSFKILPSHRQWMWYGLDRRDRSYSEAGQDVLDRGDAQNERLWAALVLYSRTDCAR